MTLPGFNPPRSRSGSIQVQAFLAEVQQSRGLVKVEDARGQEVPAALHSLSDRDLVLLPLAPLDLGLGDATHLVFLLEGARFRASASVLQAGLGQLTLSLPREIVLADRRKTARGLLQVALMGLVSPLASAATPTEPTSYYLYEPGQAAAAQEPLPSAATGTFQPPTYQPPRLFRADRSPGQHPLVSYLQGRLESRLHSRLASLYSQTGAPRQAWPEPPNPIQQRQHNGLLAHGCTFHFLPILVPAIKRGGPIFHSVRFEVHVDPENVQLSIRLK